MMTRCGSCDISMLFHGFASAAPIVGRPAVCLYAFQVVAGSRSQQQIGLGADSCCAVHISRSSRHTVTTPRMWHGAVPWRKSSES
jgi:hypothetical protein